jgi:hypothetical protein
MRPLHPERIVEGAEDLADSASGDSFNAWMLGVVLALALAVYAFVCLATQSAHFVEGRPLHVVVYKGGNAVAFGSMYLAAGVFLHCHFFWSWRERFQGYAQIGKLLAMVGVVGGMFYFIVSVFIFG